MYFLYTETISYSESFIFLSISIPNLMYGTYKKKNQTKPISCWSTLLVDIISALRFLLKRLDFARDLTFIVISVQILHCFNFTSHFALRRFSKKISCKAPWPHVTLSISVCLVIGPEEAPIRPAGRRVVVPPGGRSNITSLS